MSTELRKLLENAKGTTEHVVAIVLDIRGFTPFCKEEESLNVASFLKRIYIRVMDEYFPNASFYKPTGDGLLIVTSYTAESLKDSVKSIIANCMKLLDNFGKLREGDDMIYFPTPDKIGIGVSRGPACRIYSDGTIVDYSGKVINLASRLNDFARPCGIVFDSSLGWTLLPKDAQEMFLHDDVYVRGIAEEKPITIYYTKGHTIIPPSRKKPLKEPKWEEEGFTKPYLKLKELSNSGVKGINFPLKEKPLDEKQIYVEVGFDDSKHEGGRFYDDFYVGASKVVEYHEHGAQCIINFNLGLLLNALRSGFPPKKMQ